MKGAEVAALTSAATEKMDRIYRHQRKIYDVTRRYFLLGRRRMIEALDCPPGGTVLEVGCGTAWNLVEVARRNPDARLHGFDISGEMLKSARQSVERNGLGGRIALAEGDATAFSSQALFGSANFDRVFTSYTLSMIPDWRRAVEQAAAAVAPGGALHVVDFGMLEKYPPAAKAALDRWLSLFSVVPRRELEQVLADVARRQGFAMTFERPFGGYAQYGVLTRRS